MTALTKEVIKIEKSKRRIQVTLGEFTDYCLGVMRHKSGLSQSAIVNTAIQEMHEREIEKYEREEKKRDGK